MARILAQKHLNSLRPVACHKEKTGKADIPRIAKTKRISDREKGIRRPRTITRWRRFDGSVVEAGRQR